MNEENRVIILPGYSLKNKQWAQKTAAALPPIFKVSIRYWPHWTQAAPATNWLDREVDKLQKLYRNLPVDLIAKSIGSYIAVKLLQRNPGNFHRLLICGLPINDLSAEDKNHFSVLGSLPAEKVLVIQNETDNHGSFTQVKAFVQAINPHIDILSRPRNDHEYPYPEDFIRFLTS